MPGPKQDQIAAAQHVAYVAASYLASHASRQELVDAVAEWSAKTGRLGKNGGSPATTSRGGGGGTSLTHPESDLFPESEAKQKRQRQRRTPGDRRGRETWLTPFGEAWSTRYDCPLELVPWGELANYLRPLTVKFPAEVVLARWVNYLTATEARFASPKRFASTFGSWDKVETSHDPFDARPGESVDAYIERTGRAK